MKEESLKEICRDAFKGCDYSYKEKKKLETAQRSMYGLEDIIANYKGWLVGRTSGHTEEESYKVARYLASKFTYSKHDIRNFCDFLIDIDGGFRAGIYVSALINKILTADDSITIDPTLLLNRFGYMHSKGKVIVKRSVGSGLGTYMTGGSIIVEGIAEDLVGYGMEGGEIYIKKNAGNFVGSEMTGGIIKVDGVILSWSNLIKGGEIWEGGKKVFPY